MVLDFHTPHELPERNDREHLPQYQLLCDLAVVCLARPNASQRVAADVMLRIGYDTYQNLAKAVQGAAQAEHECRTRTTARIYCKVQGLGFAVVRPALLRILVLCTACCTTSDILSGSVSRA